MKFTDPASVYSARGEYFVGREKELLLLKDVLRSPKQVVNVYGRVASGKTSLVKKFLQKNKNLFPGGIFNMYHSPSANLDKIIPKKILKSLNQHALLVIDEVVNISNEFKKSILEEFHSNPWISIILIGQQRINLIEDQIFIQIGSLSREEFYEMVALQLRDFNQNEISRFFDFSKGNPLMSHLAIDYIKSGSMSWKQMLEALDQFKYLGITDPDGNQISEKKTAPPKIIISVTEVNDELINMLKSDPNLLRSISSRKFEKIVAELLARQGYDVELTPSTRDGGFDLYAAKNEQMGKFLYLVECKKYTPPNKVGIQVVRSLYGVVKQKKATAGLVATTSFFTSDAKLFQSKIEHEIKLQDYLDLQRWLKII